MRCWTITENNRKGGGEGKSLKNYSGRISVVPVNRAYLSRDVWSPPRIRTTSVVVQDLRARKSIDAYDDVGFFYDYYRFLTFPSPLLSLRVSPDRVHTVVAGERREVKNRRR